MKATAGPGAGAVLRQFCCCSKSAVYGCVSLASASVLSGLRGTSSTTFLPGTQSMTTL
ncbi:MAG: hypothetical protein WDN23_21015 [Edaphobacter sp.]